LFDPVIDIALISIALSTAIQLLSRKLVDRKQLKIHQEEIKKKQKRMQHLMKEKPHNYEQELDKLQKESMELMSTMMSGSTKQMMVSFAVYIPFLWFFNWNYVNAIVNLPVPVPFWTAFDWGNANTWFAFKLWTESSWVGWYVLVSLIYSLLFNGAFNLYETYIKNKKMI